MARRYNIDNYLIEMSASEAEQILGLSGKYSASQVKSSYRKMSMKHHPDRGGSTEMMKKVNAAYEMLKRGSSSRNSRPSRSSSESKGDIMDNLEKHLDKEMRNASKGIIKRMKKFTGLNFKIKSFKIQRSVKPLKVLAEMQLVAKDKGGSYHNIFFDMKVMIPAPLFPNYSTLVQVWIDGDHDGEYFEDRLHSETLKYTDIKFILVFPDELIPEKKVKDLYKYIKNR